MPGSAIHTGFGHRSTRWVVIYRDPRTAWAQWKTYPDADGVEREVAEAYAELIPSWSLEEIGLRCPVRIIPQKPRAAFGKGWPR